MAVITIIMISIMILVYLSSFNNYQLNNEVVNYAMRSFYHANMAHLISNMISFYYLSPIEDIVGETNFVFIIVFIWIVSSLLLYTYHQLFPSRKVYTIGFSGIIFGLIVVYYSLLGQKASVSVPGLIISILPQLVVPNISFEGHIAGIIAGALCITFFPSNHLLLNK